MADLPDIDTSSVSYLAYWNAIDQGGVSSISPTDAVSAAGVSSYTTYDNGIEGVYTLSNEREAAFRVKTDGWVVVYLDQSKTFGEEEVGYFEDVDVLSIRGPWDIMPDWTDYNNTGSFTPNTLTTAIQNLQAEFDNSGNINFNTSDTGLYNYEETDATNVTALSKQEQNSSTGTCSFLYTGGTTRYQHTVHGSGATPPENASITITNSGTTILSIPQETELYGTRDALAKGYFPSSDTEYTIEVVAASTEATKLTNLALWG